jgi:hypothetical protein
MAHMGGLSTDITFYFYVLKDSSKPIGVLRHSSRQDVS